MNQIDPYLYLCIFFAVFCIGVAYVIFAFLSNGVQAINKKLKEEEEAEKARQKKSSSQNRAA